MYKAKYISTGSLKLDKLIGGFPKGHITQIFGGANTGKSSIVLSSIRSLPTDNISIYIDADFKFDSRYVKNMGIDLSSIVIIQNSSGDWIRSFIEGLDLDSIDLFIIDSIAALDVSSKPTYAANLSTILRTVSENVLKNNIPVLFINQTRWSPGQGMVASGAVPAKWYPTISLKVTRTGSLLHDVGSGHRLSIEVAKNRLGRFGRTNLEIYYGLGIDKDMELLELAVDIDLIQKEGTWYKYNDLIIGQGRRDASVKLLNLPMYKAVKEEVYRSIRGSRKYVRRCLA